MQKRGDKKKKRKKNTGKRRRTKGEKKNGIDYKRKGPLCQL